MSAAYGLLTSTAMAYRPQLGTTMKAHDKLKILAIYALISASDCWASDARLEGADTLLTTRNISCDKRTSMAQTSPTEAPMLKRIRVAVGAASCARPQHCATLALGHRACGGPETYIAYSKLASNIEELHALAEAYRTWRAREVIRTSEISDCQVLMDPGSVCRRGQCILRPTSKR